MAVQGTCLGWLAEMVLKNKGLDGQRCGTLVLAVAYYRLAVCATTVCSGSNIFLSVATGRATREAGICLRQQGERGLLTCPMPTGDLLTGERVFGGTQSLAVPKSMIQTEALAAPVQAVDEGHGWKTLAAPSSFFKEGWAIPLSLRDWRELQGRITTRAERWGGAVLFPSFSQFSERCHPLGGRALDGYCWTFT